LARILFAWELGANLGHLGALVTLAKALRSRGHEAMFAVRDLAASASSLDGFAFAQAPLLRSVKTSAVAMPSSYAEIMAQYGFTDRDALLATVRAWRQIFRWTVPDVIVCDHAPTALVAARGLVMRRVLYGVGFASPPRVSPLPSFRTWQHVPEQRLQASESVVLDSINLVLAKLGAERLNALHELFGADEAFLCTFPELDHYGARVDGRYCGPMFDAGSTHAASWHASNRKKIFVYMRPNMAGFQPLAQALKSLPYSVLWVAPGADSDLARQHENANLRMVGEPVDLTSAVAQANAAVLYGSHGTTAAMLLAGVPMAVCPNHVEQMLVARNVERLGAGRIVMPGMGADALRSSIEAVVEQTAYTTASQTFAARYAGFDPCAAISHVAARIHACCERAPV